jgi:hypothetical protein
MLLQGQTQNIPVHRQIPKHWTLTVAARMHLLSLGVTGDELVQLEGLVARVLADLPRAEFMQYGTAKRSIYLRCTARQRWKNGVSAPLFGIARFRNINGQSARAAVVYELPIGGALGPTYDPWKKLWAIKDLDLDMPHR